MIALPAIAVDVEPTIGDALLEAFSGAPFYILANGTAFFLGEGCQKGQHQFAVLG